MIVTTVKSGSVQAMATAVHYREAFRTHGALRGGPTKQRRFDHVGTGQLPNDWRNTFTARSHVIDYVIMSYQTPIAWHDREAGWIVPDERYSVTTTVHQSRARHAIVYYGGTYSE